MTELTLTILAEKFQHALGSRWSFNACRPALWKISLSGFSSQDVPVW